MKCRLHGKCLISKKVLIGALLLNGAAMQFIMFHTMYLSLRTGWVLVGEPIVWIRTTELILLPTVGLAMIICGILLLKEWWNE
jgi:hypothetical protein